MGCASDIPGPELRMGTSVFVARDGRTGLCLPTRLHMSVRCLAGETRRNLMGVVEVGGFRYSEMWGMRISRKAVGGGGYGGLGFGDMTFGLDRKYLVSNVFF